MSDFISCPRFGGSRFAPACINNDRYKNCRRKCASLREIIDREANYVAKSLDMYRNRYKNEENCGLVSDMKSAGKFLPPDPKLCCPRCRTFVAKSQKGLRIHLLRTHKEGKLKVDRRK